MEFDAIKTKARNYFLKNRLTNKQLFCPHCGSPLTRVITSNYWTCTKCAEGLNKCWVFDERGGLYIYRNTLDIVESDTYYHLPPLNFPIESRYFYNYNNFNSARNKLELPRYPDYIFINVNIFNLNFKIVKQTFYYIDNWLNYFKYHKFSIIISRIGSAYINLHNYNSSDY